MLLALLTLELRLLLLVRLLLSEREDEEDAESRSVLATISATEARCSIPRRRREGGNYRDGNLFASYVFFDIIFPWLGVV